MLWPTPPTQVGHYAAVFTGLDSHDVVLENAVGAVDGVSPALLGFTILILTDTRTALLGLVFAVLVASLSLFTRRRRFCWRSQSAPSYWH